MRESMKYKIIISICATFFVLFFLFLYIIDEKITERVGILNMDLTDQLVDARGNQISYWLDQRKIELEMIASAISSLEMDESEAIEYIESVYGKKSDVYTDMGIVKLGGYKLGLEQDGCCIKQENYYRNALRENSSFKISDPIIENGISSVIMLYKVGGVNKEVEFVFAEVPLEVLDRIASKIDVYGGSGDILSKNSSIYKDEKISYVDFERDQVIFETDIAVARGWSLNYYIPKQNINSINSDIRKSILVFQAILLTAIVILLILSFTSIIRPIEKLKTLMKKVEDGDFSVRLKLDRKDELGSLASSFNNMTKTLENLSYKEKEMKLKIMQEQIKPHFLYNTLDTIKWAAMEDDSEEVLSLIDSLSTYFRIGLSNGKAFISLDEELEHIDSYLRIQKARYEDRLNYTIHYDESLVDCVIVRVLLQPIVENALIHGVNKMESGGKISVSVFSKDESIFIKIMNNSQIDSEVLKKVNRGLVAGAEGELLEGYGLYSVNHRIKLEYGKSYGLKFESKSGWTIATIKIPIIKGEK